MPVLVPILLYHSVSDDPPPFARPYSVAPAAFARHLDAVVARGLVALTVGGYADALERDDRARLERAVVITFDDGLADFATEALPALQARGLASTLFVTTGCLAGGTAPAHPGIARHALRWSQLPGLRESGVEIGGHSHSHPHLDTLSARAAREEIGRCTASLEDALGAPVASFAYPHGYSSPRVRAVTRAAGYRAACGVKDTFSSPEDDRFALARLMLRADTPAARVERWLDRLDAPRPVLRESVRTRGWRLWRRGRALLSRRPGADPAWQSARQAET
jgi:peptidoglycan/xylan/chitin deacetylase (PgdA/CDA1 family)